MGHAYEIVTSDAIVRWHRGMGRDAFFLTGSDEHGNKIAQAADDEGIAPIELCDRYVAEFKSLYASLGCSFSHFIRTSSPEHTRVAREVFRRAAAAGDIYLGVYEGWYNAREEAFVSENDAAAANYTDPATGLGLTRLSEPTYFFRLSRYHEQLKRRIDGDKDCVQPPIARNEILERLKSEPLRDLSVSRTNVRWGIPCPPLGARGDGAAVAGAEGAGEAGGVGDEGAAGREGGSGGGEHVMYVWFDALVNYLSGAGWRDDGEPGRWPCDVHIIGKDITWFHAVIWPAMLLSAGIEPPRRVFAHGFVTGGDGRKMSKTLGNGVSPGELLGGWGADSVRFFLCTGVPYGSDLPLNLQAMADSHNANLANGFGNLAARVVSLAHLYTGGRVPDCPPPPMPMVISGVVRDADEAWRALAIHRGAEVGMGCVRETNRWLYERAPWALKGEGEEGERSAVVRGALEALYLCALLLSPILPRACASVCAALGAPAVPLTRLSDGWENLPPGGAVGSKEVLFERKGGAAEAPVKTGGSKGKGGGKKGGGGGGKDAVGAGGVVGSC